MSPAPARFTPAVLLLGEQRRPTAASASEPRSAMSAARLGFSVNPKRRSNSRTTAQAANR